MKRGHLIFAIVGLIVGVSLVYMTKGFGKLETKPAVV